MKTFLLLVCLPLAFSVSQKKLVYDSMSSLVDFSALKQDLQIMLDVLGSDPIEQACETECHKVLQQGQLFQYSCPFICHALQNLVTQYHLTTPKPAVGGKRMIFDSVGSFFDFSTLKTDLQIMVDVLGSDPSEVACEAECHKLLATGHVLNYGCPFVCHAFQTLIQKLHVTAPPAVAGGMSKRMVFDSIGSFFDFSTLKADLQIMVDVLGSDPSEVACEAECHKLLATGHVLNYGCPFVCHAFQTLIQKLHITAPPAVAGGMSKRMVFDSIGSFFDFSTLKADLQIMVDVLGSDPSEVACEAECHKLLATGHLLNYGCQFVCHAFQTLIQKLHVTAPPAVAGGMSKRMVFDSIGSFFDFSTLKADLQIMVDVLGSDPSEVACEAECHKLLATGHVLNYGCPFVCHAFQTLVQKLHVTAPPSMTGEVAKRMILDSIGSFFDFSTLKADLQIMVDVLGSDPTEVACEAECHKLLATGHVLNYGCPFVCHAFQTLVQQLHITAPPPSFAGGKQKRMILDSVGSFFDFTTLKADLQIMLDVLGSDPTEVACEAECHKLLATGHVLNYGCPFVCHAFQTLVQQLHLTTPKTPV